MAKQPALVWLRRDLRLHDNPALHRPYEEGRPVIPVYIWAPEEESPWEPGGASRWWIHHSLEHLERQIHKHRSQLIIRRGPTLETLRSLLRETGATAVYWNRLYDPATIHRDAAIKKALSDDGIEAVSFSAALLHEPHTVATGTGKPYQVFTPFWRTVSAMDDPPAPLPIPRFHLPERWPESLALADLQLLPTIPWDTGLREEWKPGEENALETFEAFLHEPIGVYTKNRNTPGIRGTSRLSPALHHGEISPRTIWHQTKVRLRHEDSPSLKRAAWGFLRELGWREFNHHLLYHFPHTTDEPLRENFRRFPWRDDPGALRAWQRGRTGYPIVDAGMRELYATGWMHNRVRMIVASFLVKHLRLPWQEGARWFWDTLVDADLANNSAGWQWAAGCGADAAPYFRIFNPITQGEKFDPEGVYTRHWVPEVAGLPDNRVFKPWEAAPDLLNGAEYPPPLVDHREARAAALAAFDTIKTKKA